MNYELQLNPFVRKDGWKYKVIRMTDITYHTSHKQPTASIGKKIRQALRLNKSWRIYGSIDNSAPSPEKKLPIMDLLKKDPELLKVIQDEEKNGYKVLLEVPNELPFIPGKDTIEFMASVNGKRILRGLAKNNPNN